MIVNLSSLARFVLVASFLFSFVGPVGTLAANPPEVAIDFPASAPTAELKTGLSAPITPSPHPILSDIRIRRAIAHARIRTPWSPPLTRT